VRNFEIARLFYEMASLLEVRGESAFRIRAYQRGAQTLETLSEDVGAVAARGELLRLPGIGKDLAAKIQEYLARGRIARHEALREGLPPTFLSLLEIRGLGPKTARALVEQLGIDSIERLEEACRSGRIIGVAGVRERTCANILKGIAEWKAGRTRVLLPTAHAVAAQVAQALRAHGGVERLEIAGSLRRMRESVKDVDILVTSTEPARVLDTLVRLPSVVEVSGRGDTKASVRHQEGLAIDVRVVEPAAFGAALQYFTGSREHNVRLRQSTCSGPIHARRATAQPSAVHSRLDR
jgi:DNA polymerase (family 10)